MFHVKHFGTIDGLRKAQNHGGARYGTGILAKQNFKIGLGFGLVIF
jgi:hypothetical protein